MSTLYHGPKIRQLSQNETLASIENWKSTVVYGLRLNPEFKPYLKDSVIFGKKSRTNPHRDLTDTTITIKDNEGKDVLQVSESAEDKCEVVDMLLDQIANWAQTVPRNDITKDSRSLKDVWSKVKLHYNKQQSGSLLNDVWKVKREPDETPQALLSRLRQIYDENLLTQGGLYHVDGQVTEDEEMSPTLLNTIILQWLEILHPQLRDLVTQKFITQLREGTYGALLPEISRSVDGLLDELNNEGSASRLQSNYKPYPSNSYSGNSYPSKSYSNSRPYQNQHNPTRGPYRGKPPYRSNLQGQRKSCEFCRVSGKIHYKTHSIEECMFVKRFSQNRNATANLLETEDTEHEEIDAHFEEYYSSIDSYEDHTSHCIEHVISRVSINASPVLTLSKDNKSYNFTLDSGATCSCIDKATAAEANAIIRPTSQRVRMADGISYLPVIGETEVTFYKNNTPYVLSALVCEDMDTKILAGMEFLKKNDVGIRPATDEIILQGREFIKYDPIHKSTANSRRLTSYIVKADSRKVILPGESANFSLPEPGLNGSYVIEPRWDAQCNKSASKDELLWPKPQIVEVTESQIKLVNPLPEPVIIKKLDHVFQVQPEINHDLTDQNLPPIKIPAYVPVPPTKPKKNSHFSDHVSLNPDNILSKPEELEFRKILSTYDSVFDPTTSTYNGKSGPCFVEVNIGNNIPPQRKGRVPFYGKGNLIELQNKFDELQSTGILSRPQEVGVTVENTNPSFLVNKQPPSTDKRLVTDFTSIADYCRPTPSLMPDVESTLKSIGSFKYMIKTDMSHAYFQIPMKKSSKKYCGVHTPFRGLLVYNVGVMGLPGVEVALEELTSLILGDLVREGKVAKTADDVMIGGNTPEELKQNFQEVLVRLHENNLKLKASKTVIAPKEVTILGWIWCNGKLRASPHKLLALSTCPRPETITAMRSYIGAYRHISRTLKGYSKLLSPLEDVLKGKEGKEKIPWTDGLQDSFKQAQLAVSESRPITIPQPSDTLSIVTDASARPGALGAILYTVRKGIPHLAGFFNCKLPAYQQRWLPCELEALGIASALCHFAPYIIESNNKPQVITDSKPCVDAVSKLKKGQFSASARLSTFLSTVSRFQAVIQHISGAKNVPSDYLSRHPLNCDSPSCSICTWVSKTMDSVVQSLTVNDITEGRVTMPFTNRKTWSDLQDECKDLRKVKSFRQQGTNPSKKTKHLKLVRRYLSSGVLLAHDNTLIHPHRAPLRPTIERIVVPQQILHGILTVLHLKFNHPTAHQLSKVFSQYFFALNLDKLVTEVSKSCDQCAAIKDIPKAMIEQSTDKPPTSVGIKFAADIIKRCGQKIMIIRETVSSYTLAELVEDETAVSVSESLVRQCNILRPSSLTNILIRVDPAPAHKSLFLSVSKDSILVKNNISLEIGRPLNKNKNPVIDKCIREIHRELLIINPTSGPISSSTLSHAIASLNSRYRKSGLSAHETWTQRDQITGHQLPISDRDLIIQQHKHRLANHPHSKKSKSSGKPFHPTPDIKVGSLIYLYSDRKKTEVRPRYLVTSVTGEWCKLRRFTSTLIGHQEYDARLEECYAVPHIDNSPLPHRESFESSDSDSDTQQEDPNFKFTNIPTVVHTPMDPNIDSPLSDDEISIPSEDAANSDTEVDVTIQSPSPPRDKREQLDPGYVPPRHANVTPSTMDREVRVHVPPKRYGYSSS